MSRIWVEREHRLPDDFEPPNMSARPPAKRKTRPGEIPNVRWPEPEPAAEPGSMIEPSPERCAGCGKCPRCGQ